MPSVKKNFVFNIINTITGILFPIVTLPYVFRVLVPEGIGTIDFLNAFVNYLLLIASLGIPIYAVKEVAKYRDDEQLKRKITVELFLLGVILSIVAYVVVFILAQTIPQIKTNETIFYILSLSIIFNALGVQWFFQAIEDFAFITIRAILVRLVAIVLIFLFVKNEDDLINYALILVFSSVGNNLFNIVRMYKYIPNFADYFNKDLNLKRHIQPALQLFTLNIIISLYVNLDAIMLGFYKGEEAVGYYSAAIKFYRVVLTLVTSLGIVLLPRMSNLVQHNNKNEFARLAEKSILFTSFTSIPLTCMMIILAPNIIMVFSGRLYEPSILVLQMLSPIILLAGLTNVFGIQMLYPLNKQKLVIYSVSIGAIICLTLNVFLIPQYGIYGAAFSTLLAEVSVFLFQIFCIRTIISFNRLRSSILNYLIGTVLIVITIIMCWQFDFVDAISLILYPVVAGIVYLSFLIYKKDKVVVEILNSVNWRK
ncbi:MULTISPECIES: flippase [unclassified Lonepinella]|uniref:flippase n=1 Tax=unclassified Lonepinella TaxID=2642006 RepID=UPI0036DC559C